MYLKLQYHKNISLSLKNAWNKFHFFFLSDDWFQELTVYKFEVENSRYRRRFTTTTTTSSQRRLIHDTSRNYDSILEDSINHKKKSRTTWYIVKIFLTPGSKKLVALNMKTQFSFKFNSDTFLLVKVAISS